MPTQFEGGSACSAGAAEIVVVDTSPVRNFVEAGAQRAFAGYLGSRVRITVDVSREGEGHRRGARRRLRHDGRLP